jgi:hypothetical protein
VIAWRCRQKSSRLRPTVSGCRSAILVSADIISVADIAKEPLIMLTVDEIEENTGKLLTALGARPHVAFRTRSVEAVRSLVATGAGIALLPDLVYRPWSLEGDRIESRDVSGALPVVQVGMVWRKGSGLPQSAKDFIGMAEALAQRPGAIKSIDIGKTDSAILINEFAKAAKSRHLSFWEQNRKIRTPKRETEDEADSEILHRAHPFARFRHPCIRSRTVEGTRQG